MEEIIMEKGIKVCEISTGDKGSGYFSKELINRMMVMFMQRGSTLTDIFISQKDADDVHKWIDSDISEGEREEVFNNNNIWHLNLHKMDDIDTDSSGKSRVIGFDFKDSEVSKDQKLSHAKTHLSGNGSESSCIGIIDRSNK